MPTTATIDLSARALVLAACLGLSACSAGSDASRPTGTLTIDERAVAVPMQADEFAKLGYRVEWRGFPTMLPGGSIESCEVLGDALAVQDTEGVLTILDTKSGQQRWSDQVAGPLTRFLGCVRTANTIVVASESDMFYYDASTGTLKNKQNLAKVANTRPALVADTLVFGTTSGHIVGHQMANGFALWGSGMSGSVDEDPVQLGTSGELAFASQGGEVLFLDGLTGHGLGRGRMFSGPGAAIAASDVAAYVPSLDHSLYAFNKSSGNQLWRLRTDAPLRVAPTYHNGVVYCDLGAGRGLTALDANTGKVIWQNADIGGRVIAKRKGKLIAFDGKSARSLDIAKGKVIDAVDLTNIAGFRTDTFEDGVMYAYSPLGVITKLTPR